MIEPEDFAALDMRVGRVTAVHDFPEARRPAWWLEVDFGPEVGVKTSSARLTHYSRGELEGRMVVAVVNLRPLRVGPVLSEVLILGALDDARGVALLSPDGEVAVGSRIA